jgi:hypothetical protein
MPSQRLARLIEDDRTRFLEDAVQDQRQRLTAGQEPRQLGFALLDRLVPKIAAVKLQEIERAVDRRIVTLAPAKELEIREAVRITRDQLVDDAGANRQSLNGGDDRREAPSPIEPTPGYEADALAVAAGEHAIAVMFDLVQPLGSGRRAECGGREAGLEGPGHVAGHVAGRIDGRQAVLQEQAPASWRWRSGTGAPVCPKPTRRRLHLIGPMFGPCLMRGPRDCALMVPVSRQPRSVRQGRQSPLFPDNTGL